MAVVGGLTEINVRRVPAATYHELLKCNPATRTMPREKSYFFPAKSRNAAHRIGAASGPTLFSSPYWAFFSP